MAESSVLKMVESSESRSVANLVNTTVAPMDSHWVGMSATALAVSMARMLDY